MLNLSDYCIVHKARLTGRALIVDMPSINMKVQIKMLFA
jgi:hypothetical protein